MQYGQTPKAVHVSQSKAMTAPKEQSQPIERIDGDFAIDATLIGELLDVPAADVPAMMRNNSITGVCESGVDADQGTFRLNLFHRGRHARLRVDAMGRILQRSIIDFGEPPLPRRRRRSLKPALCNVPRSSTV